MPTSSTARTAIPPAQSNPATPSAIDLSMFEISVSQLLGFDYVFLGGPATACFSQLSTAKARQGISLSTGGLRFAHE